MADKEEYRRTGMLEDNFYDDDEDGGDGRSLVDGEDTDDINQDGADEDGGEETSLEEDTDDSVDGDDGDTDGGEEEDGGDGVEEDALTKRFRELGLDKTYSDPLKALESIPHHNSTVTQALQDKAELMRLLVNQRQSVPTQETIEEQLPDIDGSDFIDDPIGTLKKLGLLGAKKVDPNEQKEQIKVAVQDAIELDRVQRNYDSFVQNTPDYHEMFPIMQQIYRENPSMKALPLDEGTRLLYELASNRIGKKKVVQTTTNNKLERQKLHANTSSTRNSSTSKIKKRGPKTEEDLNKMSERELERYLGYGND